MGIRFVLQSFVEDGFDGLGEMLSVAVNFAMELERERRPRRQRRHPCSSAYASMKAARAKKTADSRIFEGTTFRWVSPASL